MKRVNNGLCRSITSSLPTLILCLASVAGSSSLRAAYGYLEPGFRNQDYSQNWLPGFSIPTTPGWIHVVLPINPNAPKIDTIAGVVLKMWSGDSTWGQTGTTTFWLDNVKLIARTDINS